ncbi:hypothetical protein ACKAV7_015098 [Fusarium commune]
MPHATSPHVEEAINADEYVKLILCFDGTGNTFSGTNADTNVVKILRKLDRNHKKQYHYYQKAKIYIFGFSQGAFTAKYLSRMVNEVGLLCKGNEEMVPFAYRLYQRSLQCKINDRTAAMGFFARNGASDEKASEDTTSGRSQSDTAPLAQDSGHNGDSTNAPNHGEGNDGPVENIYLAGNPVITPSKDGIAAGKEVKAFSQTFCRDEGSGNIKVFLLSLWDCVNSVAMVERNSPAPVEITGTAHHVRHAMAVDEHRVKFKPALLDQDIKTVIKASKKPITEDEDEDEDKDIKTLTRDSKKQDSEKEDIRDAWFPGNHGDVGGG